MKQVYVLADNIISPLGVTTADNFRQLVQNISALGKHEDLQKSPTPFVASIFERTRFDNVQYSKFESLLIQSIEEAIQHGNVLVNDRTGLIISSTKGNISHIENVEITDVLKKEVTLFQSAAKIANHFNIITKPIVVSHACISGLVALITARRMLLAGLYDTIIVSGADIITRFILSGFQSFQAISDEPCKPFDADRKGINLGEAAATIILTTKAPLGERITLNGGSISNDANHISGPSRTGEELFFAIRNAMQEADVIAQDVDFISAHGTATLYNDDMESKAFTLADLQNTPVNSLKGYYGHTLGAAGLLESVISIQSLRENKIIPTKGFQNLGTEKDINVCSTLQNISISTCLKTASGFGGCNAAVVFKKNE